MQLKEAISKRQSVRSFSKEKPSRKLIDQFIEYANLAPSAGNLQSRDFVIIDDESIKKQIAEAAYQQNSINEAAIIIVACANLKRITSYGKRGETLYALQDTAAAIEHILLLATEKHLASCWIGAFQENKVSQIIDLPSYSRPIALIPIGYPAESKKRPTRMKHTSLIHYNKW